MPPMLITVTKLASAILRQLFEIVTELKRPGNDQHIINIVDWMPQCAYAQRASDIQPSASRVGKCVW